MELNCTCNTNGKGLWSSYKTAVKLLRCEVSYENEEGSFGELRIFFDKNSWNCDKLGLIYTDPGFMNDFRDILVSHGFTKSVVKSVDYSEHGMQGDYFVSCDIGKKFLAAWRRITGN